MLGETWLGRPRKLMAAALFCLTAFAATAAHAEDLYGPIAKSPRNGGTLVMGSLFWNPRGWTRSIRVPTRGFASRC